MGGEGVVECLISPLRTHIVGGQVRIIVKNKQESVEGEDEGSY